MPQRLVQTAVLGERARQLERGPQGREHALGGERLLEELERAQLGGAHGVGEVRLAAHHDHREVRCAALELLERLQADRKSTRLNSSHVAISYAVFCLKK